MPRKKLDQSEETARLYAEICRLKAEVEYWKGKTDDALTLADRLMSKLETEFKAGHPARPEPVPASCSRQSRRYWMPRRRRP